jgi:very-short-patch-repair endonuclease
MPSRRVVDPQLFDSARALRRDATPSEQLLWSRVRARRLAGFKFRRQHPMAPYVLDFYCAKARLAIEIDGEQHHRDPIDIRDAERTAALVARGVRVLRFTNEDVLARMDSVLEEILNALRDPLRSPPPSRASQEGGASCSVRSPPASREGLGEG